jgi:hypothetical protein
MKKRCLQYNGFVFGSQIKKREGHLFFADFFVIFRSDFFVLMKSIFLFASFLFLLPSASAVNEMCSSDTECGVGEYCELTSCKSETGFAKENQISAWIYMTLFAGAMGQPIQTNVTGRALE